MARDQYLVGRTPGQIALSVCQVPIFKSEIDAHLVVAILERQHLVVGQAESPVFLVVRSSVRNPVRMIGKREQVRLQARSAAWSRLTGVL